MNRLVFKQRSKDDLLSIFDYIARDSLDVAESFVEGLISTCELLQQEPELGMLRPHLAEHLRLFVHRRYCIYYQFLPGSHLVSIVRILHPALDVEKQDFE